LTWPSRVSHSWHFLHHSNRHKRTRLLLPKQLSLKTVLGDWLVRLQEPHHLIYFMECRDDSMGGLHADPPHLVFNRMPHVQIDLSCNEESSADRGGRWLIIIPPIPRLLSCLRIEFRLTPKLFDRLCQQIVPCISRRSFRSTPADMGGWDGCVCVEGWVGGEWMHGTEGVRDCTVMHRYSTVIATCTSCVQISVHRPISKSTCIDGRCMLYTCIMHRFASIEGETHECAGQVLS
jgi:hypothetical protein